MTITIENQPKPPAGPAHLHAIFHDAAGFHPMRSACPGCRRCAAKAAEKPVLMSHGEVKP